LLEVRKKVKVTKFGLKWAKMSQWQPFESPQLDDMVAWDWMKSPETMLNNVFTLFHCVKKY
jgi:hypothetical protein